MMQRDMGVVRPAAGASTALRESITRVFFWMAFGVGATALVAMAIASSASLQETLTSNTWLLIVIVFAQLGIVVAFWPLAQRLSSAGVAALFLAYAALVGVTFSTVFVAYTKESIASTFFVTAGMFGAVGLYGATTKRDLSTVGSLAFMGLIGVLLAMIVNIFLRNTALQWLITLAGVAVFVGLTAHDMQKIKQDAGSLAADGSNRERWALLWALRMYLNFINLFLFLLRIFGVRR